MNAILILFYLLNVIIYKNEVTPCYKEAYNYILSDSFFKEQCTDLLWSDTAKVAVSDNIWNFSPYPFSKEIVNYEFTNCSDSVKNKIEQYITIKQAEIKIRNDSTLNQLDTNNTSNSNVLISFSEIVDNKLTAEVLLSKKTKVNSLNHVRLTYLFYFNQESWKTNQWKIVKVFRCVVKD